MKPREEPKEKPREKPREESKEKMSLAARIAALELRPQDFDEDPSLADIHTEVTDASLTVDRGREQVRIAQSRLDSARRELHSAEIHLQRLQRIQQRLLRTSPIPHLREAVLSPTGGATPE